MAMNQFKTFLHLLLSPTCTIQFFTMATITSCELNSHQIFPKNDPDFGLVSSLQPELLTEKKFLKSNQPYNPL